jgi:hypothetical protein
MSLNDYKECDELTGKSGTQAVTSAPDENGAAAPTYSVLQLCPWAVKMVRDVWPLLRCNEIGKKESRKLELID